MTKPKVVLDTNIYLSGIIFGGNCKHILDLTKEKEIISISSPLIFLEIAQKLEKKFQWNKEKIILTIKTIAETTEIVFPKREVKVVKADKDDNKIIEAAIEGKAGSIITGDKHLLKIKKFEGIKILSVAQFLS